MNRKGFGWVILFALIMCSPSIIYAEEMKPRAFIEQNEYEFPAVVEGVDVVHEFVLKNTGTAPLEIIKLKAG